MKRKNKRWTLEDLELLENMYMDPEITLEEIASVFNTSKRRVIQIAKYYRIKRRKYEDEGYRKCYVCNLVLPLSEFYYNKLDKKYHKTFICKHCSSERCKKYYCRKKESVTNE